MYTLQTIQWADIVSALILWIIVFHAAHDLLCEAMPMAAIRRSERLQAGRAKRLAAYLLLPLISPFYTLYLYMRGVK